MFSCNSLQKFQTIYFVIYKEITFWVKSMKSELYQKGWLETNFKHVATITTLRGTMHACFSILASKSVNEKLHSPPPPSIFRCLGVIWKSHDKTRLIYDVYDFPPHTYKYLNNFMNNSQRNCILGIITKIWIISKLGDGEQISNMLPASVCIGVSCIYMWWF